MFDPDIMGLPPITSPTEEETLAVTAKAGPQRTGMFGVRGGWRDVLGTLGDAFLTQAGRQAVYRPQRDRERMADALGGFFSGDKSQQLAALETAGREFPEETAALWNQYLTAQSNADYKRARNLELGYTRAGAFAGAALKGGKEAWARNRSILQSLKDTYGLDDIDIPQEYDPEVLDIIANGGMTRYQQQRAGQLGADTASKIAARDAKTGIDREKLGVTKTNVASQVKTRDRTATVAERNAAINEQRAGTYAADVQSRVKTREKPPAAKGGKPAVKEGEIRKVGGRLYIIKNGKPVPYNP